MNINPNQFQSAGELPVYQGGINTGTNWGENTGFSENNVEPQLPGIDFGNDGGNLRRRRKNEKENSLVPSPISLPSMAAAASAALALPKAQIDVLKGVGGFINKGASGALDMGKNFAGTANREVGGGLEDLTIAAKNASRGVLGTLGKAAGSVGKGLGSVWDAIEPSGGFLGDVPENAGKGLGAVGKGLGSVWDAIEPSGGFIGDIPEALGKGWYSFARSDIGTGLGNAGMEGYKWITDRIGDIPHWVGDRVSDAPGWIGDQFKDYYNRELSPESIGTKKTPIIPLPEVVVRSAQVVR